MKKIYSIILVAIALFAIQSIAKAQPYTEKNGIAYSKYPTGPVNGIYTIHLDTFVTGEVTVSQQSIPADIVLVLDVSGSMDQNITVYSYTARASQPYTYSGYGYNTYYYKYTDGNYYQVSRGGSRNNRYLRFQVGDSYYYLNGTGISGTQPFGLGDNSTIYTGVLYTRGQGTQVSKMDALKEAVSDFIDVIKKNNDDNGNLGSQISIVKFAMNVYAPSKKQGVSNEEDISEGDESYRYSSTLTNANYTQVVKAFTNVNEASDVQALKDAVNGLHAAGATAADFGMRKAELLLKDLNQREPDRESNKTVILFTDGDPTYNDGFQTAVAGNTISKAHDIKLIKAYSDEEEGDIFTSVFTVGVFSNPSANTLDYMDYTSSNYPDATAWTPDSAHGTKKHSNFFQNASGGDLSAVFRSIAHQAGGSGRTEVTAAAATTVDVVSQSFDLPDGASTDITVYFANCNGKSGDYLTFDEEHLIPNPEEGTEGHVTITIEGNKVTASGFEYSENWCGFDESINDYHGMKLMLLIPIEMSDDAVGGNAVGTNGPESGIYVDGKPVLIFEIPHIDLPTNLHIQKEIADGECATFEIYRKKLEDGATWETKPFKTVMVIGGNNDNKVKLMGLDPHYLYKIVEAGWSWTYDLEKVTDKDGNTIEGDITSDKLELNPFIFVNSKKDRQIRHAESAVYNDFRTAGAVEGIDSKPTTTTTSEVNTQEGN